MAVNRTGAMFKSLTFDGEDSRDYGVYITGQAVFNAPEREVEMISIPGRNGQFALDKGRFENIEVTYPAGIFANTEADFAEAVSNFRNLLCSKRGYVRLQDEYHPDEYRMAIYKSGLELENVALKAGEFEITFDCKPQRYLTSGESAVTVTNGGVITNPTLFDASPLLQLSGYGSISINGQALSVNSGPLGDITVASEQMANLNSLSVEIGTQYANNSDKIKVTCALWQDIAANIAISNMSYSTSGNDWAYDSYYSGTQLEQIARLNNYEFSYGTSQTVSGTITATCTMSDSSTKTAATTFNCIYNGSDTFTFSMTSITMPTGWTANAPLIEMSPIILNSSQSRLGNPLYIDLEIGEAYKIENNVPVSINTGVTLPAKLPTLPSGTSTITFDNTYSQVKIVPRWWKV